MTKARDLSQVVSNGVSEAFKNRIINGAMVIDQRSAGASSTPVGSGYTSCDRWNQWVSQASKYSVQRSTDAPAGFVNSQLITSLSAYSVLASDTFSLSQQIEGNNVADLGWGTANAKTVTLSFWVRSSVTGTFGGALANSAVNRSYPFTYTISAANTWEQKTITVAGDTTGTWLTDTGIGLRVWLSLGAGSTYLGTAGAWATGDFRSATGATSVVGTNGATFYLTGCQLEVGSTATSFDYRPYGTELALCQRYFQVLGSGSAKPLAPIGYFSSTGLQGVINTKVTMRTAPTFSIVTGTSYYIAYTASNNDTLNSVTLDFASTDAVQFFNNTEASGTANAGGQLATNNASAFIAVQAEL